MRFKKMVSLLAVFILCIFFPMTANASQSIVAIEDFDTLSNGDGQYLSSEYRDNYHLDIKELSIIEGAEKTFNNLANSLFWFVKSLSYWTVVIFHIGFSLDVSELFGAQINTIQAALKSTIFDGFFLVAFAASAIFMLKQLVRRNTQALLGEFLKVIAIVVISFMIVRDSSSFLSTVNRMTKETAVQVLGDLSGSSVSSSSGSLNKYATEASGILWSGLVHKPWVMLEFGDNYSPNDGEIESILSQKIDSDQRADVIKQLNESKGLFEKSVGVGRIGTLLALLIPLLIKDILFLLVTFFQLSYQAVSLFYVLTSPVVLVLAVAPSFGGMDLIWNWLKKIIETQINVLVLSFIIGLIVKFDDVIFSGSFPYGWLIGLAIQIFLAIAIIMFPQKFFNGIMKITKGAHRIARNPKSALQRMDAETFLPKAGVAAVEMAGDVVRPGMALAGNVAGNIARSAVRYIDLPARLESQMVLATEKDEAIPEKPRMKSTDNVIDFKKIPRSQESQDNKTETVTATRRPYSAIPGREEMPSGNAKVVDGRDKEITWIHHTPRYTTWQTETEKAAAVNENTVSRVSRPYSAMPGVEPSPSLAIPKTGMDATAVQRPQTATPRKEAERITDKRTETPQKTATERASYPNTTASMFSYYAADPGSSTKATRRPQTAMPPVKVSTSATDAKSGTETKPGPQTATPSTKAPQSVTDTKRATGTTQRPQTATLAIKVSTPVTDAKSGTEARQRPQTAMSDARKAK